jgi:hypothetical protein
MKEDRRQKTEDRRGMAAGLFFWLRSSVFCLLGIGLLASGCASNHEQSTYDRQEQALKDPFGYNPDLKKSELSVDGDGDKDALKRDVDHVLNP